ncbi:MAG: isochorismatase family protein [Myxococcaceae bacterium]
MASHRLSKDRTALLVIDVQERLAAAMNAPEMERVLNRTRAAITGAKALRLPVVLTEQYPKGLGPTVTGVKELLGESRPIEKVQFSCVLPEVLAQFGDCRDILVTGMETHVCVFQTVRDLVDLGFTPYLCADAVLSRTALDREVGLNLCKEAGAKTTTVEAALFDLLGKAGTPEFKQVSNAVK